MTMLDRVLARLSKLPPERQEAMAVQLEFMLRYEERAESYLSDEQWKEIEAELDAPDQLVYHELVSAELTAKFPK